MELVSRDHGSPQGQISMELQLHTSLECLPVNHKFTFRPPDMLGGLWKCGRTKKMFILFVFVLTVRVFLAYVDMYDEDVTPPEYAFVICTLVKNEAFYLPEWLDFHMHLGVDRVVIYDDNSSDSTAQVLSQYIAMQVVELIHFPPSSCGPDTTDKSTTDKLVDRCERCRDEVGRNESHQQRICQLAAFSDCAARYRKRSRWLAIIDVDEFVFPCASVAGADSTLTVTDTLRRQGVSKVKMECLKFGTSGHKYRVQRNESLLGSHLHRAPYQHLGEPEEEVKSKLGTCEMYINQETGGNTDVCETSGGEKYVARADRLVPEMVETHNMHVTGTAIWDDYWIPAKKWCWMFFRKVLGMSTYGRDQGDLCCNHYAYRSEAEMVEKAEKNQNPHIKAQLEKALPFYNYIIDVEILKYTRNVG